jgi:hypothetical protein
MKCHDIREMLALDQAFTDADVQAHVDSCGSSCASCTLSVRSIARLQGKHGSCSSVPTLLINARGRSPLGQASPPRLRRALRRTR